MSDCDDPHPSLVDVLCFLVSVARYRKKSRLHNLRAAILTWLNALRDALLVWVGCGEISGSLLCCAS